MAYASAMQSLPFALANIHYDINFIFRKTIMNITINYTIAASEDALIVGIPVIAQTKTVTIASGGKLRVLN